MPSTDSRQSFALRQLLTCGARDPDGGCGGSSWRMPARVVFGEPAACHILVYFRRWTVLCSFLLDYLKVFVVQSCRVKFSFLIYYCLALVVGSERATPSFRVSSRFGKTCIGAHALTQDDMLAVVILPQMQVSCLSVNTCLLRGALRAYTVRMRCPLRGFQRH